jgi:uncharacterized protein (TIGR02246 family)
MGHEPSLQEIVALEQSALARWCRGDPSGFLELSAPDVVYFDPFVERRIDGLAALTAYYEALRGQVLATRFEVRAPLVQAHQDTAVLTFQFVSWGPGDEEHRWNCTEVYRRREGTWSIIQTHWSRTKPGP